MPHSATSAPGYQLYQPKTSKTTVQFSIDALDKLLSDVMTGFGAVPRRGAEVGGVLLGRIEGDTIWVDDVITAPCEHRRGPSFLLSEKDQQQLDDIFAQPAADSARPVGMFRSNTRDADVITDEDRDLFGKYFPDPTGVLLLVRPFATKLPIGGFLFYEDGALPTAPAETFPLQRKDVEPRSRGLESRHSRSAPAAPERSAHPDPVAIAEPVPAEMPVDQPRPAQARPEPDGTAADDDYVYAVTTDARARRRRWMWIPLSFIFLLLGILLGFQTALIFYPRQNSVDVTAISLGLTVLRRADNLHIRWNRDSVAIRGAQKGKLTIEDGAYHKAVDLDASALQNGSVIYPPTSANVALKLEVSLQGGTQIMETLGWSKKAD